MWVRSSSDSHLLVHGLCVNVPGLLDSGLSVSTLRLVDASRSCRQLYEGMTCEVGLFRDLSINSDISWVIYPQNHYVKLSLVMSLAD